MSSELIFSFPLSKRLKTDSDFKTLLFPQNIVYNVIEKGINIATCLDENESLFTKKEASDSSSILEMAIRNSLMFKNKQLLDFEKEVKDYKCIWQNMRKQVSMHNRNDNKLHGKVLTLIPMVIVRDPSPMKSIRFMDYVFPLDSEMFLDYNLQPKLQTTFIDVSDYKRVKSAFYDKQREIFTTQLIEKTFANGQFNYFERQLDYYVDWQNSLNNKKAYKFANTLNAIKVKAQISHKKEIEYSNTLKNDTNGRTYIKKIDEETHIFLKTQPLIIRQHKNEFKATSDETGLIQEEYNWPYQNQLGYHKEDEREILHKLLTFEILKSVCTRDTYETITALLSCNRHTKYDKEQCKIS